MQIWDTETTSMSKNKTRTPETCPWHAAPGQFTDYFSAFVFEADLVLTGLLCVTHRKNEHFSLVCRSVCLELVVPVLEECKLICGRNAINPDQMRLIPYTLSRRVVPRSSLCSGSVPAKAALCARTSLLVFAQRVKNVYFLHVSFCSQSLREGSQH